MDPKIFKAYDIRGVYPDEINAQDGYAIGYAYAQVVKPTKPVVVGWDVRVHSKEIADNVIKGLTDSGGDVINVGLVSTEMLYFAVGSLYAGGGIQVTASHNPPEYHGMKMVRAAVVPVSGETGLMEIRDLAISNSPTHQLANRGTVKQKNIFNDYIDYAISWIDKNSLKPMKVVYNANFGFEGKLFEALVKRAKLPIKIAALNGEPDGTFPKGRPDPFIPENRGELIELVHSANADLGVAWDADADRVFFCAEGGQFVMPYYTNLLLIEQMLKKYPGAAIVYDPRTYWATVDAIKKFGGKPVASKVGHSYIKTKMRSANAVFCGEASGHTYFRDFWFADAGMLPLLLILELLSKSGKKLSELVKEYTAKYPISEEVNSTVANPDTVMAKIEQKYADAKIDKLDGLSIEYETWRANIRKSNTEPLLRLNVEAKSRDLVEKKQKEILTIIRD